MSFFALLNWSFRGLGSYSYMYAAVLANFIAISVAFLGYKWFVFQNPRQLSGEWIRCFGVYGSSALIGLVGFPILVPILRRILPGRNWLRMLQRRILTVVTVIFSFVGHKKFSFKQKHVEEGVIPPSTL